MIPSIQVCSYDMVGKYLLESEESYRYEAEQMLRVRIAPINAGNNLLMLFILVT